MARFGSLGTQYFDDNGDPLVSGRIYFYESGTTTPKNTYADIGLTVANTNPVILSASGRQPNIFFDGIAKGVLTDSDDAVIETRDPIGDTEPSIQWSDWEPYFTYGLNAIVLASNGVYYISIDAPNQGNDPTGSPDWWEPAIDYFFASQTLVPDGQLAMGDSTTGLTGLDVTALGSMVAGDGNTASELEVGTDGQILMANAAAPLGVAWTDIPRDYQVFTSSDTWTKPDNVSFVMVELWGAGGGGASRSGTTGCGGGSGGEYSWGIFRASDLAATLAVTIGEGGAGGAAGGGANAGTVGGTTSFGSHLDALGGNPGTATAAFTTVPRSTAATSTSTGMDSHPHTQSGYGGHSGNVGGSCRDGGAGGGGSAAAAGGTSERGGNGGAGQNAGQPASPGVAPGGGGGAADNQLGGGAGARGEARIWSW